MMYPVPFTTLTMADSLISPIVPTHTKAWLLDRSLVIALIARPFFVMLVNQASLSKNQLGVDAPQVIPTSAVVVGA